MGTIIKQWLLHFLVVWTVINAYDCLTAAFLENGFATIIMQRLVRHNLQSADNIYLMIFLLLVELNFHLVFKQYPWYFYVAGSLAISVAMITVVYLFRQSILPFDFLEPVLVLTGYALVYGLMREFFHQRLFLLQVRINRSETELHILKQQVNPHFLFNTLNYLYGMALKERATQTAEGIDTMAAMMRYAVIGLQENKVPLSQEIQFIDQYIHLSKLRLSENARQRIDISLDVKDGTLCIAPLLLLPYIENAFKFGIQAEEAMQISIHIWDDNGLLRLDVSNRVMQDIGYSGIKGTGSGLKLSKKRLQLLYPKKHTLNIRTQHGIYDVHLNIQLK